ncbi:ribosome biogenesis GTPase Der [Candidatus Peregrinibacteria bacterium]|nr:MAG: ribosome biogenesis GTPase Der [Candidatus Peregrinibacteria bacterium]
MSALVAIIGRPNVGKSRLFNRIVGEKKAIVSNISGTTRDRCYGKSRKGDYEFNLVDTGGLEYGEVAQTLEEDMKLQTQVAIGEADIILFLTDSKSDPLPDDYAITEMLRQNNSINTKPVFLILSKCDETLTDVELSNFYALGFDKIIQTSAIHNKGISELLQKIHREMKKMGYRKTKEVIEEVKIPTISIVGRPNVGKSSMINALINEERLIVSDIPGTTRDANDMEIQWENEKFCFIDTAGIRRRGKIEKGIEKWALARTLQNLDQSDITCLLIDGEIGVTAQDQHIVEKITEANTGIILIVNKWDTQEKGEEKQQKFLRYLQAKFAFLRWVPVLFVSAKTKQNLIKIFPTIQKILEQRSIRISTGKMNTLVKLMTAKNPPKGTKRIAPKIFYMSQVDINPPKFKVFVNKKEYFHFSYFRFIENQLRELYGFWGSPIILDVVDRKSIYQNKKK